MLYHVNSKCEHVMSKQLHPRIDDDLYERVEELRNRMAPKPSMNALINHILRLWVDGKIDGPER